jgi:hypothetical protein
MTLPLRQALSRVFSRPRLTEDRPASTLGELEVLGAVSAPKAWYRLHLINAFVDPEKHRWTPYYRMSESQARYWQTNATRSGGSWIAYLEKFVDQEGWVEV